MSYKICRQYLPKALISSPSFFFRHSSDLPIPLRRSFLLGYYVTIDSWVETTIKEVIDCKYKHGHETM